MSTPVQPPTFFIQRSSADRNLDWNITDLVDSEGNQLYPYATSISLVPASANDRFGVVSVKLIDSEDFVTISLASYSPWGMLIKEVQASGTTSRSYTLGFTSGT